MADPGIGTHGDSIDLLTALDLLGKAEARVAELEAALQEIDTNAQLPERIDPDSREAAEWWKHVASKRREIARAALAAVRQEKP